MVGHTRANMYASVVELYREKLAIYSRGRKNGVVHATTATDKN